MDKKDKELMEAVTKIGSGHLLVNIIMERVRQLQSGSKPLIEDINGLSVSNIAVRELLKGKISFRFRNKEPVTPTDS